MGIREIREIKEASRPGGNTANAKSLDEKLWEQIGKELEEEGPVKPNPIKNSDELYPEETRKRMQRELDKRKDKVLDPISEELNNEGPVKPNPIKNSDDLVL